MFSPTYKLETQCDIVDKYFTKLKGLDFEKKTSTIHPMFKWNSIQLKVTSH
jgi:hypothetical protein